MSVPPSGIVCIRSWHNDEEADYDFFRIPRRHRAAYERLANCPNTSQERAEFIRQHGVPVPVEHAVNINVF